MPVTILMPALSPTMEEGTLARWLKKEGDTISSGDVIAEIETDKATMEFEAVDEGTLGKIIVPDGTAGVKVNDPIAVLLEEGESAEDIGAEGGGGTSSAPEASGAAQAPQPDMAAAAATPAAASSSAATSTSTPAQSSGERIFASPLARRIAAEKGLDLSQIKGSGPHGRIVKTDVENAKPGAAAPKKEVTPPQEAAATQAKAPVGPSAPSADAVKKIFGDRKFEEVTLDGMRKTIAARLSEAKQTIPHFYLRREIRLDPLLKFRSQLNKELEERGVKLSVNDFIIKASALALIQVPDTNAVWAGDRVLKFERADVAVAVAIEGGLFTPVIRDADLKTMSAISKEMKDLAKRARDRKLAPHEYQGGSFAVSNLGMFGIENFDAVINPPHASILAAGGGIRKPIVNEAGEIEVATVMSVTLSVDHRVIDGALGAQWLEKFKTALEKPLTMLT
jgi:pyruvate dehydrogenase E2 component (dihydrolipoamide acetyltransferase)